MMDQMYMDKIKEMLKSQQGHVGFYYKNLITGEAFGYQENEQYSAASVIKLPIFMCVAKWIAEGRASWDDRIKVTHESKVPICGALTLFSDEPLVDLKTLCKLMISLSDNCATNLLITHFGIPAYMEEFARLGLKDTVLARVLFDPSPVTGNFRNVIVPKEMGMLLEQVYHRSFVSGETSAFIEEVLLLQQINHKIPGYLNYTVEVAHKTGEDDDMSLDVGVVFTKKPFIVCFAGHDTNVGEWENLMRQVSLELVQMHNQ
jgi:beta-lactamase class A